MSKASEIAAAIKPFVLQWIGGGGGASTTSHADVTEGPDVDLVGQQIGRGGDSILLFDSGGNPVAEFAATSAGLDLASAAATAGDWIVGCSIPISGDHTLKAGVKYGNLVLSGQITGADTAWLVNSFIERTANDANALNGAVAPVSGTFRLWLCYISCVQSGSGQAAALYNGGDGTLKAFLCEAIGTSVAGSGYGSYRDPGYDGYIYVDCGILQGSTSPCNEP